MRLLVLGGTRFVGRAVIAAALDRGWQVTALHRGITGEVPAGVQTIRADRTDPAALQIAGEWDLAVDTWSGDPVVAATTAAALRDRVGRFGYVSSVSVYEWGRHVAEDSPVVAPGDADYAAQKRAAEIGVLQTFPDALLARAGLILGPHEDIGRLPWWLQRIARGGDVVAPGRPERPLQYVDARDLAGWLLDALDAGVAGPVDVVGPSGWATTASLLNACVQVTGSDARLCWVDQQTLAEAGVQPWTELPIWVPEHGDFAGFLEVAGERARATGLVSRPVLDTVADTWAWLQRDGPPPQRDDRPTHGLSTTVETELLASGVADT